MTTHGLIPYNIALREKGDTDSYRDLTKLDDEDDTLPEDDIFDLLEEFLNEYEGELDTNSDIEKTFSVRDYEMAREENVVEGIIETGQYGYASELKDVDTGEKTHDKGQNEVEQIQYYFLFHLPQTTAGEPYDGGEGGLIVFQQFNGKSVKSAFTRRFDTDMLEDAEETMFEIDPVTTREILDKVLSAQRVMETEFEMTRLPTDSESKTRFVEGVDTSKSNRQSIVMKPSWGGSIDWVKAKAREIKGTDQHNFTKVVADWVNDMNVTIKNENGREETFSLMEEEFNMKKELDPSPQHLDGGLPTPDYVCRQSCTVINQVLPDELTSDLDYSTRL